VWRTYSTADHQFIIINLFARNCWARQKLSECTCWSNYWLTIGLYIERWFSEYVAIRTCGKVRTDRACTRSEFYNLFVCSAFSGRFRPKGNAEKISEVVFCLPSWPMVIGHGIFDDPTSTCKAASWCYFGVKLLLGGFAWKGYAGSTCPGLESEFSFSYRHCLSAAPSLSGATLLSIHEGVPLSATWGPGCMVAVVPQLVSDTATDTTSFI